MIANFLPSVGRALNMTIVEDDVTEFFFDIVRETLEYRKSNNVKRDDFLQLVSDLKDSNELTFNELVAQCFVFFAAGFETSSTAMTFTIYEIAQNQAIQDKVRKEINDVLKKHDGKMS